MDSDLVAAWFCGDLPRRREGRGGTGNRHIRPHTTLPWPLRRKGRLLSLKRPFSWEAPPLSHRKYGLVVMKPDLSPHRSGTVHICPLPPSVKRGAEQSSFFAPFKLHESGVGM